MGFLELFFLILIAGIMFFTIRDALFNRAFESDYEKYYSITLMLLFPGLGSLIYLIQKALKW